MTPISELQLGQRFRADGDIYTFQGRPGEDLGIGLDGMLSAKSVTDVDHGLVTLFRMDTEVEVRP